jgi:hypothetical protein
MDDLVVCDLCGASAPAGDAGAAVVPLTWSTAVELGRSKAFCAECSRRHLRAIEGKLDSDWW